MPPGTQVSQPVTEGGLAAACRQVREIRMQDLSDKTKFCLWIVEEKEVLNV